MCHSLREGPESYFKSVVSSVIKVPSFSTLHGVTLGGNGSITMFVVQPLRFSILSRDSIAVAHASALVQKSGPTDPGSY